MRVISTAGHVDHGKSTLVEVLTGTHPDRLKEERDREMTIDLGFAWMTLPEVGPVGIVDVPGHRDFVENMLAGVGSVDAALLVIAADEGLMPQTYEHLAILDLLQIESGVVALTKTDLSESSEWIQLVSSEVASALAGTAMGGADIVPVSSLTGEGIRQLQVSLTACLSTRPPRADLGRPRLSVDRVFTIAGFGTVVTGTLVDGCLKVGDEISILPRGERARIRGLQTHKTKLNTTTAGSRVAINMAGVEAGTLRRGDVVSKPGTLRSTKLIDVHYRHLHEKHSTHPLRHNADVKVFIGAAQVMARVRLLSHKQLPPSGSGWLQLDLRDPVVTAKGDHLILRRPSPPATIGGGTVVDPHPIRRWRLHDERVLSRLETNARGTPGEILLQAVDGTGPGEVQASVERSGLDHRIAQNALEELVSLGEVVVVAARKHACVPGSTDVVISRAGWNQFVQQVTGLALEYHLAYPLRVGIPREELKSRLGVETRVFNALIGRAAGEGILVEEGPLVHMPNHQVEFTRAQQVCVDELLEKFRCIPYNTPSRKNALETVGEELLAVLIDRGVLIAVAPEVLFLGETCAAMVSAVREQLSEKGTITVSEVRDLFSNSRKYALALLEYMDRAGITVRRGDERVLTGPSRGT